MSRVAIITGASRGIGAATAIAFGKVGYDVVVNYKSNAKAAQAVVKQIGQAGQQAVAVQADVFTEAGIKKLFKEARAVYPKIDVLVNNACEPTSQHLASIHLPTLLKLWLKNSVHLCSAARKQLNLWIKAAYYSLVQSTVCHSAVTPICCYIRLPKRPPSTLRKPWQND